MFVIGGSDKEKCRPRCTDQQFDQRDCWVALARKPESFNRATQYGATSNSDSKGIETTKIIDISQFVRTTIHANRYVKLAKVRDRKMTKLRSPLALTCRCESEHPFSRPVSHPVEHGPTTSSSSCPPRAPQPQPATCPFPQANFLSLSFTPLPHPNPPNHTPHNGRATEAKTGPCRGGRGAAGTS